MKKNKKNIKIILALVIWLLYWFAASQKGICSILPDMGSVNNIFIVYNTVLIFLAAVVVLGWKIKINNFNFLKIKNKKILWFYLIPFVLAIRTLFSGEQFGINSIVWTLGIIISTFLAQDIVTFGFLQTYLEKLVKPFMAFLLTSSIFFFGHLIISNDLNNFFMITVTLAGSFIFGFLRYKTKSIYPGNIIHVAFLLIG